jgi:hypothetical protein
VFELIVKNILSTPMLSCIGGVLGGLFFKGFRYPASICKFLMYYLVAAIGLKGGAFFSNFSFSESSYLLPLLIASVFLGLIQPVLSVYFLKKTTQLDRPTMAAISAQYGSINLITFFTALSFLDYMKIGFDSSLIAIVAIMEIPAIITALFLAKKKDSSGAMKTLKHAIFNPVVMLLIGCFAIGYIFHDFGFIKSFQIPFQYFLSLFLIDMGIRIAQSKTDLKKLSSSLLFFGIYMPIVGAVLGFLIAYFLKVPLGTAYLFTVLSASASYIAAPAAMKLSLPEAKEGIYLPLAIGITFPFNVVIGIPLFFKLMTYFYA